MIFEFGKDFILSTKNTSYVFGINEAGMAEHMHYGSRVSFQKDGEKDFFDAVSEKISHVKGGTICYEKGSVLQPEDMLLEISSVGKGDFRDPFFELEYEDGSSTSDLIYKCHRINETPVFPQTLPSAIPDKLSGCEQITVTLKERVKPVEIDLYYTVYPECDVITRRAVIRNTGSENVKIRRAMSLQLDLDDTGYRMITFNGAWAREMHRYETPVEQGKVVNSTFRGVSSNQCNPFVMLAAKDTCETSGECFAFNLVYSGNHYEAACVNPFYKTRFVSGINPDGFSWVLEPGCEFETPEAVMSFSNKGFRGISLNMHSFVRRNIVRGKYKDKQRPVLLNSWEAVYFNINESRLLSLAKKGKEAGIELLVMDDGWFKGRNDDTSSLGDWTVEKKKLPGGVESLAKKVHELGLDFGIWVEPEMVNEDSDLYRAHPEYAMSIPGRENSLGRNQMNLDLTNPDVVSYIKDSMRNVFSTEGVNYVKWDMNRVFSDVYSKVLPKERQGETMHRYYIGLYDILKTLNSEFSDILFEGCSSGGNRFDLGMLCYFPQIWASDDTDAIERTDIQNGYSYGYPMSVVSAHVSACPNHQTLRNTPLETRFNIAAFGVLGYELNLSELSNEDFKKVRVQTETYKEWRDTFFYGDFYRVSDDQWMVVSPDKKRAATVVWNRLCSPNDFYRKIRTVGLSESTTYHVYNVALKHNLKQFGDLVNQVAPIHIKKDSFLHNTIARFYRPEGETEDYVVTGETLNNAGIKLTQAFGGTGFSGSDTRVFQDFASRMYFFEAVE